MIFISFLIFLLTWKETDIFLNRIPIWLLSDHFLNLGLRYYIMWKIKLQLIPRLILSELDLISVLRNLSFTFIFLIFIDLKGSVREGEVRSCAGRNSFFPNDSALRWPQQLGLVQAGATSLELLPGFPHWWQGFKHADQLFCCFHRHIIRELDWKWSIILFFLYPRRMLLVFDWDCIEFVNCPCIHWFTPWMSIAVTSGPGWSKQMGLHVDLMSSHYPLPSEAHY